MHGDRIVWQLHINHSSILVVLTSPLAKEQVPKTKINRPQKRGEEKKERYHINFLLTASALFLCSGRVGGHIIKTRWRERARRAGSVEWVAEDLSDMQVVVSMQQRSAVLVRMRVCQ